MSTITPKKLEVGEEVKAAVTQVTVPSKMTAAVLYGSEDLRIEKIDVPALAADEVLVRVRLALTDGTDLKVWKRGYHAKMIRPPAVFGHELVGEIVAVGKRVDPRWRIGMRVIAANSAPCLRCYHCRRGQENLCDDLLFNNGAYADYMRIPGRIVVENMLEVPHSVDDQSAALAEPLACVLRGIHEMEVRTGDTTAVIGCGPIGLKFVRMLSRRGVRVIALARRAAPLDVAKRLGAVATFNVTQRRNQAGRAAVVFSCEPNPPVIFCFGILAPAVGSEERILHSGRVYEARNLFTDVAPGRNQYHAARA